MENNPRTVFERLFGGDATTDQRARVARLESDKSLLDSVTERVADIERTWGRPTSAKLDAYLDAVRDVERVSENRAAERDRTAPGGTAPWCAGAIRGPRQADVRHAGARVSYRLTRVITFMRAVN